MGAYRKRDLEVITFDVDGLNVPFECSRDHFLFDPDTGALGLLPALMYLVEKYDSGVELWGIQPENDGLAEAVDAGDLLPLMEAAVGIVADQHPDEASEPLRKRLLALYLMSM